MVSSVSSAGVCAGLLKPGDVILSVDDHPVASDGFVDLEGERVLMAEVAERKFLGDTIRFSLLRDKKPLEVTVKFTRAFPLHDPGKHLRCAADLCRSLAGCSFQPLSRNLMATYHFENPRLNYLFDFFINKEVFKEHPEVLVLSAILPDPINTYLSEFKEGVVDEINGRKIHTLHEMAAGSGGKAGVLRDQIRRQRSAAGAGAQRRRGRARAHPQPLQRPRRGKSGRNARLVNPALRLSLTFRMRNCFAVLFLLSTLAGRAADAPSLTVGGSASALRRARECHRSAV